MTTIALSAPVARDWRLQARLDRAEAKLREVRRIAERAAQDDPRNAVAQAIVAEVRNT